MTIHEQILAARQHAAWVDVSARGAIELTGKDAVAFLHNLGTNDIKNLPPGQGCEFFLTNNKARVIGHGFAYRMVADKPVVLVLDVGEGTAAKVLAHLDRFIVSEQVELADVTAGRSQLHVCGPQARAAVQSALAATLPELKDLQLDNLWHNNLPVRVVRHDWLGLPGYDLVCTPQMAAGLVERLQDAGATPLAPEALEVLRIEAGWPLDGRDMDDNRFVVEVGRIPQAVSYAKGCYLGQEPIVMARDRGHVNRTLRGLKVTGHDPVPTGTPVIHNGQEVGQVTSAVWAPDRQAVLALAYLRRGNQEAGTQVEVLGRPAEVMALPFAAPTAPA